MRSLTHCLHRQPNESDESASSQSVDPNFSISFRRVVRRRRIRALLLPALLATCSLALVNGPATANVPVAYSFTSGPWGDGFLWPTSQLASQGPTGGIVSGSFTTPHGIRFHHLAGNPAFFDANNFQTAPANGIVGDAWWTNVRTIPGLNAATGQTFNAATWYIDFMGTPFGSAQNDFGFNLAFAQPTLSPPNFLSLQFDDAFGFSAFSEAYFIPLTSNQWQVSAGNFVSAQQPVGREAQFWFPIDEIRQLIAEQNANNPDFIDAYGFDDIDGVYVDPMFIDVHSIFINFHTLASPNNTTQLAMDNFIYGTGAKLPDMPALRYQPELNLDSRVKFRFDKPADPDSDSDSTVSILFDEIDALLADSETFGKGLFAASVKLSTRLAEAVDELSGTGPETIMTQTLDFEALKRATDAIRESFNQNNKEVELSLIMERLTEDVDRIADRNAARAVSQILRTVFTADIFEPDGTTQTLGIDDLRSSGGSLMSAANQIATRLISMQVNGSVPLEGLDPDSNEAMAAIQSILSAGTGIGELAEKLTLMTYDPETGRWIDATQLNSTLGGDLFSGVSSATYEAIKAVEGAMITLGDRGSNITGITIMGTRIHFTAEAWAVVDHNSFYRIDLIPEPGSLLIIMAAAPLMLSRRSR